MGHYVSLINGMSNAQADDFMSFATDLLDGNSGIVASGDYAVAQSSPVAMSVTVATGKAYIYISSLLSYYRTILDAAVTLSIASNSSGSDRIDLICIKIDTGASPDANASNVATVVVVQGTPGAGAPSTPANHYKLAQVTVANGAVSIVTANIADSRSQIGVRSGVKVTETNLSLADNTTADASTTKHGLLKKLSNVATEFMNGVGNWVDSTAYSMRRQSIINAGMLIAQRGVSFTAPASASFTLDRYKVTFVLDSGTPPTLVHSQIALTPGEIPGLSYCYNINTNGAGSGYGNASYYDIGQTIKNGTRNLCGVGKKVTVSFWAKSDIAGKKLGIFCTQRYGTGGSPSAVETLIGTKFTLTNTWTLYTFTFTTNTLVGKTFGTDNNDYLEFRFRPQYGSTKSSEVGDTVAETWVGLGNVAFTGIVLCQGDVALPYHPKSEKEELEDCREFAYFPGYKNTTNSNAHFGVGQVYLTTNALIEIQFPVQMQALPTLVNSAVSSLCLSSSNFASLAATAISIPVDRQTRSKALLDVTVASGLTAGNITTLHRNSDAAAYIGFIAEL